MEARVLLRFFCSISEVDDESPPGRDIYIYIYTLTKTFVSKKMNLKANPSTHSHQLLQKNRTPVVMLCIRACGNNLFPKPTIYLHAREEHSGVAPIAGDSWGNVVDIHWTERIGAGEESRQALTCLTIRID